RAQRGSPQSPWVTSTSADRTIFVACSGRTHRVEFASKRSARSSHRPIWSRHIRLGFDTGPFLKGTHFGIKGSVLRGSAHWDFAPCGYLCNRMAHHAAVDVTMRAMRLPSQTERLASRAEVHDAAAVKPEAALMNQ